MTVIKNGRGWVRGGRVYRTKQKALARADVLPVRRVTAGSPVQWEAVVRQVAPAEVKAERVHEPFVVNTAWGETLQGSPGDWLLGEGTDQWVVAAAAFDATYVEVAEGRFNRTGWALMRRMDEDFVVKTLNGLCEGKVGDVLMQGPLGDRWRLAAEKYASRGYVRVQDLPSDARPSPVPPPELLEWSNEAPGVYRSGRHQIVRELGKWRRGKVWYGLLGHAKVETSPIPPPSKRKRST